MVTNRDVLGNYIIWWHRERGGKAEEMHKIMREDLAGGHLPSARFGANAAWCGIMVLASNLNSLIKRLVRPEEWGSKQLKTIRFGLIKLYRAQTVTNLAWACIILYTHNHRAPASIAVERRNRS